ncbi:MAG: D-alanyl-D-alanine carboxypeptidase [Verrucomicrobia bacterium]|nr:MAG: D-alanyl-D-alanine carboxypeptidase [Verrucomicrobiota bacterium]
MNSLSKYFFLPPSSFILFRSFFLLTLSAASAATSQPEQASAIAKIVQKAMKTEHLRAVIIKVTEGDKVITSQAFGESVAGVPATTAMHFPNGAVAFAYLGTLLMEFVDEHKVKLDDTIDRWMPTLPEANKVTLKMLANQTSGYPDFETDPAWLAAWSANPFHIWMFDERVKYAFARPVASQTSEIPSPVLHAFDSERRGALKIPANVAFYEESSFWNVQWGTPMGANETTNIDDMATTAIKVGTGALLSKSSYEAMTAPNLLGFGHKQDNCAPSCFTQVNGYNYGIGVVRSGSWLLQNPLLDGYSATEAYLPSEKIAIAVATTFAPEAFDSQGNYKNSSDTVFRLIGAYVAPDDPPPRAKD